MRFNYNRIKRIAGTLGLCLLLALTAAVLSAYSKTRPTVPITVLSGGELRVVEAKAATLGEALEQAGILYDADDLLSPRPEAEITPQMNVTLRRVERAQFTRTLTLPHETSAIRFGGLPAGQTVDLRAGRDGEIRERVEVIYIDGRPYSENVLSSKILSESVSRQVLAGTSRQTSAEPQAVTLTATAYTPGPESCYPFVDGLTALLQRAGYGVAAVDPRVIPLGSRLYIPGYGFAVAVDTGGAIQGHRIDLCFDDVETCRNFGRREITVYILG